jgi:hypothetical protein
LKKRQHDRDRDPSPGNKPALALSVPDVFHRPTSDDADFGEEADGGGRTGDNVGNAAYHEDSAG